MTSQIIGEVIICLLFPSGTPQFTMKIKVLGWTLFNLVYKKQIIIDNRPLDLLKYA